MDLFAFANSWTTSVALLGLTLLLIYLYGTWTYSTWSQLGIPGPKPLPFLGNFRQLGTEGPFKFLLRCSKKYGKNFGIYSLRHPMLLTTDLEVVKEVFIKDFNNFAHRISGVGLNTSAAPSVMRLGLAMVNGEQWRRQRHIMTPTFSSSKLKMMGRFINQCCGNLVKALENSTNARKLLDVKHTFGAFTLDVIAGTGFGIETNSLENFDNPFLNHAKQFLSSPQSFGLVALINGLFPPLGKAIAKVRHFISPPKRLIFFGDTIKSIIDDRKCDSPRAKQDLLQLLLDAEATDAEVANNPQAKRLTPDEIVAQGILFFLAGYETTATTLQYLTYLLAMNPDKQEKLHDEIVEAIGDTEPSYEKVMNIPYLDCCIREALRIFPPIAMTGRIAHEERTVHGITIPAGALVMVNIIGMVRDEEIFPDSEKFIPERFQDEKHPVPQMVKEIMFGAGPRQCIGMRLALYEAKMAVVSVVKKFRFVKAKETPTDIVLIPFGLAVPDKPILVATECR